MSREEHVPGSKLSTSAGNAYGNAAASQAAVATTNAAAEDNRTIYYVCGDCDKRVTLNKSEAVRCNSCGYRVLYKERTKRLLQFEAR
ncbi:hypothetical protein K470DRAFT_268801 [Piedraia hortae CBS 480.64]|uniref:Metallothionein-I gene transcription activator n=1 Tax=Piedraia hortae CBS 480.64 TaxID=1314780 RepID=A0A6A7C793_9PEZI|nr:hypothetical protein K470DRAFT_268801 [Piedraia hortae CBS 480.64]